MSISMEIQGFVKKVGVETQVTDKYKKREIVIHVANEQNPQYDDFISVQFSQDKCSKLDPITEGDEVKVHVNVRGKEYADKSSGEKKYFNSLDGWKIELLTPATKQNASTAATVQSPAQVQQDDGGGEDLPF